MRPTMTKPTQRSKWVIIDAVEIGTPERQMPQPLPAISRLPAFDVMRLGLLEEREEVARAPAAGARDR